MFGGENLELYRGMHCLIPVQLSLGREEEKLRNHEPYLRGDAKVVRAKERCGVRQSAS